MTFMSPLYQVVGLRRSIPPSTKLPGAMDISCELFEVKSEELNRAMTFVTGVLLPWPFTCPLHNRGSKEKKLRL